MVSKDGIKDRLLSSRNSYTPPLPGVPLLELAGMNRVMIENHTGVTEYSNTQICVSVCNGWYRVSGRELSLSYMSRCQLVISGKIDSVTVERIK